MKIPITKPFFGDEELEAIQKPLKSGWIVQGPFVKEFEEKFRRFTESSFSVATTSCTTALHLSVAALGLKAGDEVIVPAFTWVSTANVIECMGAKPVFCDIDLKTFNIDAGKIESLITKKTVGIIPVHLFGLCADMSSIMEIAKKHKLWVVEDAACGLGATIGGQHAGTFGDTGCFSFHPRKSITTGEGGMITTQNKEIDKLTRALREHGASLTDLERHKSSQGFLLPNYEHLGYNYRMTDIQGALGSVQMDRAQMFLEKRRAIAKRYDQLLKDLHWLMTPKIPENYEHGFQSYVCLFSPETPSLDNVKSLHEKRNHLMQELNKQGIATRQGTHAPIFLDYYAKKYQYQAKMYPNAYYADQLSLALPLFVQMSESEQNQVCDGVLSCAAL